MKSNLAFLIGTFLFIGDGTFSTSHAVCWGTTPMKVSQNEAGSNTCEQNSCTVCNCGDGSTSFCEGGNGPHGSNTATSNNAACVSDCSGYGGVKNSIPL